MEALLSLMLKGRTMLEEETKTVMIVNVLYAKSVATYSRASTSAKIITRRQLISEDS